MRTPSMTVILSLALGMAVLVPEGSAWAQTVNVCDPDTQAARKGRWLLDVTYQPSAADKWGHNLKQIGLGTHYIGMDGDALTFVTGAVHINDGLSNTILVAEAHPAAASCADVDGDGVAGVTLLEFLLRDVRSGDLVPVFIIPNDGDLDEDGEEVVTIVIGDLTVVGTVKAHFWVFGTELPR